MHEYNNLRVFAPISLAAPIKSIIGIHTSWIKDSGHGAADDFEQRVMDGYILIYGN